MTPRTKPARTDLQRIQVAIRGAVQGVGFRPFVYRLARTLQLTGWVQNSAAGVLLEIEGDASLLQDCLARLRSEHPPHAVVQEMTVTEISATGSETFEIRSSSCGPKRALILPDLAACQDCLRELSDPLDRRYRYPFINCTNCGPRFSIIRALPYDRSQTTMRGFEMCPACRREYEDPTDRRFHAQPNACPDCGPQLAFWDAAGAVLAERDEALRAAAAAIAVGRIVAVKGLGGFHLMTAAADPVAVARLRQHKEREEKPLALMMPDLATVRACCEVSAAEQAMLTSVAAPIVLLKRRRTAAPVIVASVAPGNPCLGVMLPYTPLHALLMAELACPVVATSGNRSDEPICIDEHEALGRLQGIADCYLVHDRPIQRHVDDSVAAVVAGHELVLRRSRGYAPLPVRIMAGGDGSGCAQGDLIAVGAQLKNTIALALENDIFLSQHIGDLKTLEATEAFAEVITHLCDVYAAQPETMVCDLHPDYHASRYAERRGQPVIRVQHHLAHVLACLAENEDSGDSGPVLGVSWDGTGLGTDGTIWGGEFLVVDRERWWRTVSLRTFGLPGGDRAVREPRRAATGLLFELMGADALARTDLAPIAAFTPLERTLLQRMLVAGLNCPRTSSMGRLFDVVAALAGVRQVTSFEGQAAMELEWILPAEGPHDPYPLPLRGAPASADAPQGGQAALLDWEPLVNALLADIAQGVRATDISARFHAALIEAIVLVAREVGLAQVALTGGCFQNRTLLAGAVTRLKAAGLVPLWHRRVPPNDGGLALGQIVAARRRMTGPVAGAAAANPDPDGF